MKRILILLICFTGYAASAQVMQVDRVYGRQGNRYAADSALQLPRVTGTIANSGDTALIRYDKADSTVKVYTGFQWLSLAGGFGSNYWSITSQGIKNNQPGAVGVGGDPDSTYKLDVFGKVKLGQNLTHTVTMGNGLLFDTVGSSSRIFDAARQIRIQSNLSGKRVFIGREGGNSGDNTSEAVVGLGDLSNTTGEKNGLLIEGRSLHSSGTADMNMIKVRPTLQQSGTPGGVVRGIYIDRDSLDQTGEYRAIETDGGKVRFTGLPASGDTATVKALGITSAGDITSLGYWPTGSGGGGITLGQLTDSLDVIRDSIAAISGGTNLATADLTQTGAVRLYDANNGTIQFGNHKGFNILSNSDDDYTYIEKDTMQIKGRAYSAATNYESGFDFNGTKAEIRGGTFAGDLTRVAIQGDSAMMEFADGSNTHRVISGEDKFLWRKATIGGSMLREVVVPTWGSGRDTVATLADVRAAGGGGSVDTSLFVRKNTAAYSFKANTTGSAANVTDAPIQFVKGATYTGTLTWTNTGSAPSGDSTRTYTWMRVGDIVTLTIRAYFTTAGSNVSAATFTLPTDAPTPYDPVNQASVVLYPGSGFITTNYTTEPPAVHRVYIRKNAANNGFEVHGICPNTSARYAVMTVVYPAN